MFGFLFTLALIAIGFFCGRMAEHRHFAALQKAEAALAHIQIYTLKSVPSPHVTSLEAGGVMVSGNVVIAIDYFKYFAAALRLFFGGRLRSYESLLDRARREAVVRLLTQADALGATAIYNLRFEFSVIGQQPRISGAELLAYGTAVKSAAAKG